MISKTRRSEPPVRDRWEPANERVRVALAAKAACRPRRCGHCGSDDLCFMFDPDMLLWQCLDCDDVFVERD